MTTRESTIKLGVNKDNKPRVWLEGKWLAGFGFTKGASFTAEHGKQRLTLRLADAGNHVSGRRDASIIDLCSADIGVTFAGIANLKVVARQGEIVITPSKTARKKAARILTAVAVSLFAGGGLLDSAVHAAGFTTAAMVEIHDPYAEVWGRNHGGDQHVMSIEEADYAGIAAKHGPVGLLTAGICCEPFSAIRRLDRGGQTKRDKSLPPEAHELGDMTFWALSAVDQLNPHTFVAENVPNYMESASFYVMQHVLTRLGYNFEARILNSADYGELTARRRAIVIATMLPEIRWPATTPALRRVGDILDDIPHDSDLWFGEGHWAVEHWKKQSAKGNGFAAPAITADDTTVPTLKKRYYAGQGDNFVIAHPTREKTYRWLTLDEGKRLMGLPADYDLGDTKTHAGEVLGQGVSVGMFTRLLQSLFEGCEAIQPVLRVAS
jgi:DNA (cytosine-5)-methyltransferase 1